MPLGHCKKFCNQLQLRETRAQPTGGPLQLANHDQIIWVCCYFSRDSTGQLSPLFRLLILIFARNFQCCLKVENLLGGKTEAKLFRFICISVSLLHFKFYLIQSLFFPIGPLLCTQISLIKIEKKLIKNNNPANLSGHQSSRNLRSICLSFR